MSVRRSARLLLVDPAGRVLLLRGHDPVAPETGSWWFTPGGGVEPDETLEQAARREGREEVGVEVGELGPVVHVRRSSFTFAGRPLDQESHFFRVDVDAFEPSSAGWTDEEVDTLEGWRWWSRDDLLATTETVYPPDLADLLRP